MPSLSERVAALPQFQGRAWNEINPEEIRQAMGQLMAADQAAYDRSKRRWQIADRAAMAAAATGLGYGALSALGAAGAAAPASTASSAGAGAGAAGAASGAGSAGGLGAGFIGGIPTGTISTAFPTVAALESGGAALLPSTSLATNAFAPYSAAHASMVPSGVVGGIGAGLNQLRDSGSGGSGGNRMSDLLRYGVPAVSSLITTGMANRASGNASDAALAEQRRQFELTQAWLREQDNRRHQEWLDTEAEKKRQFDALEAEKRRRYDALQPWRDASQGALTRMSDLMNRGPQNVAYQPTFRYQP